MKINKKDIITTGLAVTLALGVLIGGGTYSYLQGQTNDVTNTFNTNKVDVKLEETTGNSYNIIPGTTQKKNPKVTVDNSVDAYVYVEVTDETEGLVTYEIADGWKLLDGYDNVYYRVVEAAADSKEFSVLKDDTVTYSAGLTNAEMLDEDGKLKEGIELTFKAYAIQKEPFNDAVLAYKTKDAEPVETLEDFTDALNNNTPIMLSDDITLDGDNTNEANAILEIANNIIDLNGKTLTIKNASSGIIAKAGNNMIIENGKVEVDVKDNKKSCIALLSNSKMIFKNVELETNATINFEAGTDQAELDIIDSTINSSDYYCVSTNAANNATGHDVKINIENSTLITDKGADNNGDCTAVLFNVPGTLNITNSTLTAGRQAVIVRCGTANIKDSTLNCNVACPEDWVDKYDNNIWGSGNEVPVATLVVGNRSGANAYPYDATCSLTNTTLKIASGSNRPQIYVAAYNGRTSTINQNGENYSIKQDKDNNSTITITISN